MSKPPAHPDRGTQRRSHRAISLSDLAQALDFSDEGFALTDPDGNYVYINAAHLRMYGYERPEELLGRSWRTLYTPEWVRHFEEAVLPIIPQDKVWRGQVISRRRDGASFLTSVTLTYLPDGKITCNCRDESATSPQDALRQLGECLIAALPDRLRHPVDMVSGYSSFFLSELSSGRSVPEDTLRRGLSEIDSAGRRLSEQMQRLDLVAELAALDRLEGRPSAPPPPERWSAALSKACEARTASHGRRADLEVRIATGSPAIGYSALETILLELLDNAVQNSCPGDKITVCGRIEADRYIFRVCDEGVGLPSEELQRPGGRILGQRTAGGFGLAIVQYILRRCRGHLELGRENGCTTCLRLILPLAGNRPARHTAPPPPET